MYCSNGPGPGVYDIKVCGEDMGCYHVTCRGDAGKFNDNRRKG